MLVIIREHRYSIAAVLLVAAVGVFLVARRDSGDVVALPAAANVAASFADTPDTDGDGLKDWEELLLGTDPNVPDAEKAAERTSLTDSEEEIARGIFAAGDDSLPAIDLAARKFFAQYLSLKQQSDAELTPDEQDALITSFLREVPSGDLPDKYETEDMTISSDNSPRALRLYVNTMAELFRETAVALPEHELIVFVRALETGREEYLTDLKPVARSYDIMAQAGALVEVPSALAGLHLDLVNDLARQSEALGRMQNVFTDPISGMSGAQIFDAMETRMPETFTLLVRELGRRGVAISEAEPAYLFLAVQ